jgi:hypothetical protein
MENQQPDSNKYLSCDVEDIGIGSFFMHNGYVYGRIDSKNCIKFDPARKETVIYKNSEFNIPVNPVDYYFSYKLKDKQDDKSDSGEEG